MIKSRRVLNIVLLVAITGGFVSCKKTDRKPPVVNLIQPSSMHSLVVPGSIPVKFTAVDDRTLTQITIELIDEQINTTGAGFTIFPEGNYVEVDTSLNVDDIYLNSGKYYLRVRAFDGINTGTAYVEIQLTGVPRVMNEVLLFSSGNPALLYQKQNGTWSNTLQFSGSISGAVFNYINQRLCISTNQPGSIQVWNLNTESMIWSQSIADAPPASATGELHYFPESSLFTGIKQGTQIIFAAPEGISQTFSINLTTSHLIRSFHMYQNYIVSLQEDVSGQNRNIVNNYRNSGAFRSSFALNETPVAVQFLSTPNFLIVTNSGSLGRIRRYDFINNFISAPVDTNPILWVRKTGNSFLMATSTHVLRYSATGSVSTFYNTSALDGAYDEVNNEIYLLKPGELVRLSATGNLLNTENVPADAVRLLCRYNK